MFRAETRHALRALTTLAQGDGSSLLAALAPATRVPAPMLAKVLHRLSQGGLVQGRPGRGGGYALARPATEIRIRDAVVLFEGPSFASSCLFGLPSCSEANPCPLHPYWGEIRGRMTQLLDDCTIGDLAAGTVPFRPVAIRGQRVNAGAGRPGPRQSAARVQRSSPRKSSAAIGRQSKAGRSGKARTARQLG
jgi:Rrf2 family transcriptional regulator, iron-sulfur cluster assembly transcription factor